MIEKKCNHQWRYQNDYIPYGGGAIQPIFICTGCNLQLPLSEVSQLEALKHMTGFQKYTAVVALVISFLALLVSILKK